MSFELLYIPDDEVPNFLTSFCHVELEYCQLNFNLLSTIVFILSTFKNLLSRYFGTPTFGSPMNGRLTDKGES